MSTKLRFLSFFAVLFFLQTAFSQKSTIFNGKPYLIYPQTVDLKYSGFTFSFNENTLKFHNYHLPPIIGSVDDGEYLIYSNSFDLTNMRKIGYRYIYDTVYHIYATFTVKDNKKVGFVNFYEKYDQKKIYASIPYINDMIHGDFVLNIKEYRNSYYEDDIYYGISEIDGQHRDITLNNSEYYNFKTKKYHLSFKNGVLDGTLKYYGVTKKKDTVLLSEFNMKAGMKTGPYKLFEYSDKKKPVLYTVTEGQYLEDRRIGIWKETDQRRNIVNENYYTEGVLTMQLYKNGKSGNLFSKRLYGKDSVLKYAKDYETEKKIPVVFNDYDYDYTYLNKGEDFIYFNYEPDGSFEYTYRLGYMGRFNYYDVFEYSKNVKDTTINGKLIRINTTHLSKGRTKETAYIIDTLPYGTPLSYRKANSNVSPYQKSMLWTIERNKKGKVVYEEYRSRYQTVIKNDTLNDVLNSTKEDRLSIKEFYYSNRFDYNYSNLKFKKGNYKGFRYYYDVKGGKEDGRILKVIKIPMDYDTLTLTDTIMFKGKYLYSYDENFELAFDDMFEDLFDYADNEKSRERFNKYVLNFFHISPVMHRSVYLGKKPFTGKIEVKVNYKRKANDIKGTVYEISSFFDFLTKTQVIELKLELDNSNLSVGSSDFIMPIKYIDVEIFEAVFFGTMQYTGIYKGYSVSASVYANKLNSNILFNVYKLNKASSYRRSGYRNRPLVTPDFYRSRYRSRRTKIKDGNYHKVQNSYISYSYGKRSGQWQIQTDGSIKNQLNYKNDYQQGMQYKFYDGYEYNYLYYVYPAKNDTVNGTVWKLSRFGLPTVTGNFKMGIPDGYFTRYADDEDTLNRFKERIFFNNGYLNGTYQYFRDSGNLKLTVDFDSKDSIYSTVFNPYFRMKNKNKAFQNDKFVRSSFSTSSSSSYGSSTLSGLSFMSSVFSYTSFPKGYYRYYYKSGTVFKKGLKIHSDPTGIWKFYREGIDRIYKVIDFRDSFIEVNGKDTTFTYGLVKAYYDDGRLMYTGYALDKSTKYSCESEADIPTEEDYYLEFYDTVGKPMLVNGNGFISELQENGYKLKEGNMVNGKKDGIWVYYSKFGLPIEIGSYDNGKKNGRWLVGDLGGLNLSDRICFMSPEEFEAWISMYGGNLNLKEEFYSNGELVNANFVETIKR